MTTPSSSSNRVATLLGFTGLVWAAELALSVFITLILYLAPGDVLDLYPFRDPSGRLAALQLIERTRPMGWIGAGACAFLLWYFFTGRRRILCGPPPTIDQADREWASNSSTAPWHWTLLTLTLVALALWSLPIIDGLQDDEADKLRIALGSWHDWANKIFDPRYNILPLTLGRLIFLLTGSMQEWVLRLPVFLLFALPLVYLWTHSIRDRYGPLVSALLLIFYGLHGDLGEYASKVQGYLAGLFFATVMFLLWSDMLRSTDSGPKLKQGILYILATVGAFFSHNYLLFFAAAQLCTSLLVDLELRRRSHPRPGVSITNAYASLAMAVLLVCMLPGLKFTIGYTGLVEDLKSSLHGGAGDFSLSIFRALTGKESFADSVGILPAIMAVALVASFGYTLLKGDHKPEAYLVVTAIAILFLVRLTFEPIFLSRYFMWLPLPFIVILGARLQRSIHQMRNQHLAIAWYAAVCLLFVFSVLPAQLAWQQFRSTNPSLRVAAQEMTRLKALYEAKGHTIGYLLLRGYGNLSHRLWFYLPDEDSFSDRGLHNGKEVLQQAYGTHDIWLVPVPRDELHDDYSWIRNAKIRKSYSGNFAIYVLADAALVEAAGSQ